MYLPQTVRLSNSCWVPRGSRRLERIWLKKRISLVVIWKQYEYPRRPWQWSDNRISVAPELGRKMLSCWWLWKWDGTWLRKWTSKRCDLRRSQYWDILKVEEEGASATTNLPMSVSGIYFWLIKCRPGSKTNKSNCQFWKKSTLIGL
jgi:hypothetical protein